MLHVHPRLYDVNLSPYRPEILAKPVSNAGNTPLALAAELKLRVQVYSRCFRAASSLTDALMVPSRLSAHQYTGGAFPGSIPPFHELHQIILKTIPVFAVPDSVFCQILVFQGDAAHKIVSSGNNDRKELRCETYGGMEGEKVRIMIFNGLSLDNQGNQERHNVFIHAQDNAGREANRQGDTSGNS